MNEDDLDQLREVYLFERRLAEKLKSAKNRKELYQEVYEEYYRNFPDHPFVEDTVPKAVFDGANKQLRILNRFLSKDVDFAEVGPGSGIVSLQVAEFVNSVVLIDISNIPTQNRTFPDNARLVISNGVNIPDEVVNVDVMYSSQLMEHLHEDDAREQLVDILGALRAGGKYICITPHRYTGPCDISRSFDDVATCLHLKEYTISELVLLFENVGFERVKYFIMPKGNLISVPVNLIRLLEFLLGIFPQRIRRKITCNMPFRPLFKFVVVGYKRDDVCA